MVIFWQFVLSPTQRYATKFNHHFQCPDIDLVCKNRQYSWLFLMSLNNLKTNDKIFLFLNGLLI